ncbi:MAG: Gfo/Idh/MocA family oxidoreductase [Actinobacteria bacterium]|nr:Gfo/Idh/MocA family oxidoreductase [Actinomycetota bacterium]
MARKLGIGVIGAGNIARYAHLPGYAGLPDACHVVAVADTDLERAQRVAQDFQIPNVFRDYEELLRLDEIDAVSVCTPPVTHAEATIAALRSGRHALCEKPMAMTSAQAREMVDAACTAKRMLAIDFQTRFFAEAQLLRRFVDAGELGDVYYARAVYIRRRGLPTGGVFHLKVHSGGGALADVGVHALDTALWFMRHPRPVAVWGATYLKIANRTDTSNPKGDWRRKDFEVDDFALAQIRFANGATMNLEASWASNIQRDVYAVQLCGDRGGAEVEFRQYRDSSRAETPLRVYKDDGHTLLDWVPQELTPVQYPHRALVADFVAAIQTGRPPLVTGEHGLVVTEIVEAIYRSAESGAVVTLGLEGKDRGGSRSALPSR